MPPHLTVDPESRLKWGGDVMIPIMRHATPTPKVRSRCRLCFYFISFYFPPCACQHSRLPGFDPHCRPLTFISLISFSALCLLARRHTRFLFSLPTVADPHLRFPLSVYYYPGTISARPDLGKSSVYTSVSFISSWPVGN